MRPIYLILAVICFTLSLFFIVAWPYMIVTDPMVCTEWLTATDAWLQWCVAGDWGRYVFLRPRQAAALLVLIMILLVCLFRLLNRFFEL